MQDMIIRARLATHTRTAVCSQCGYTQTQHRPVEAVGEWPAPWGWEGTLCPECSPNFDAKLEAELAEQDGGGLAEALAAEDKAPKQTPEEAAEAYDAETCQRFFDLVIRKRREGAITQELSRRCGQVVGAIEVAGSHPQQLPVGAGFLAAPLEHLPWEAL